MVLPIVKKYLIAIGKYKWLGAGVFVLAVGAGGVLAIQPDPKPSFTAEGFLASNKPLVIFSKTTSEVQGQAPQVNPDFLLAPEVIKIVADQTKEDPNQLRNGAKVIMPKEGTPPLIQVQYRAENPEKAKTIVSALLNAMVQYSSKINETRVEATIEELQKRLVPVETELKEAQQKLEQYDRVEGAVLSGARIGALPTAIATAQEQQRQLQLSRSGYEAQIRSISEKLGLTPEQAYIAQALSADPILASLRAQIHQNEAQLEILLQDLQEDHPKIVELRRNLQGLAELFDQRAAEVVGANRAAGLLNNGEIRSISSLDPARQQLASTLVGLQAERDRVQQQLEATGRTEQELRAEFATLPNKQLERERLLQQLTIKKTLYDNMQTLLADARTAQAEVVSSVNVLPQPPRVYPTTKPNLPMPLVLVAGGVVGLVGGGVLIFLVSLLDGKLYTVEEVRAWLQDRDLPVLGVLPAVWLFDSDPENMPLMVEPHSPYLEFYERLRTALRRVAEKPVKILLLTSAAASEGKTFCAYNLAIASARAGKRTLLFEADLRQPSRARSLKVAVDPESSLEPLRYYGQPHLCIRMVPLIENLYLVPSLAVRNGGGIWDSSEVERLFKEVRGRFDLVVVDAPALSTGTEALLLEPLCDGMAIVTRPLVSEGGMLTEFVEPLIDAEDVRLLGSIINGVDIPVALYSPSVETEKPVVDLREESRRISGISAEKKRQFPQPGEVPSSGRF
ncbi:lipopolysaccharide biosynthesis [Ancylothrix sp. C2]|uniref:GumC family protein n=1 Tax=Ancylothrix sp. D3o TaxID=2953691 RepID=UPI0021BB7B9D|nr:tyrosine-protein kinase domain-containing protein [Ancylothrix sp. D3o]MCT7950682.1 lipopolysaccharide biosynthesis [Ancylothrix sp. D3o]